MKTLEDILYGELFIIIYCTIPNWLTYINISCILVFDKIIIYKNENNIKMILFKKSVCCFYWLHLNSNNVITLVCWQV